MPTDETASPATDAPAQPARQGIWRPSVSRETALGFAAIALAAYVVPYQVLHHSGWPNNDEGLSMFERMEAFRRAFRLGDWYPLWTPFAHSGWGSPYPLFYHRLYSTIGALLAMAIDPVKPDAVVSAVKTLTVALLFLGGAGMRRLLKSAGADEATAVCGALLFVVAPYTRAEWFARGAMAEFTAMMMLPWLYAELALFVQGRRRWIVCAIETVLLFFAHSMICLYFLLSTGALLIATAIGPNRRRTWGGVKAEWPRILLAVVIGAVCVLPHALVAQRLMPYFNTDIMTKGEWRIRMNFHPFSWYFADPFQPGMPFQYDRPWFALEVNRYVLASLAALVILPGAWRRFRSQTTVPLFTFMLVWFVVCMLLQEPTFRAAYRFVPQGKFLQFPWRLLCFMTVCSIVMFMAGARTLLSGTPRERVVGRWGPWGVVVLSLWTFGRNWIPPDPDQPAWAAPEYIARDLENLNGPLSAGEYQLHGMNKLDLWGVIRPFVTSRDCAISPTVVRDFSTEDFKLVADEPRPCLLDLRQFQTPLLRLSLQNATLESPTPSLEFEVELGPGPSAVRLRPRTLWEMVRWIATNPPDPT